MVNAKKIVIETESHEVFIVHINGSSSVRGFCEKCGRDVHLCTLDEAVSRFAVSTLDLLNLVNKEQVHYIETANRHLLICSSSLEPLAEGEITT